MKFINAKNVFHNYNASDLQPSAANLGSHHRPGEPVEEQW
jgi:hypothetical protein